MRSGAGLLACAAALAALGAPAASAMNSATIVHAVPSDFDSARAEGLVRPPFAEGLFKGSGTLESAAVPAPLPFDDLVASWNADMPRAAGLELAVQVLAGGAWSPWYVMGRWEDGSGRSLGGQAGGPGRVDADTLKLSSPASAFRYRVAMSGKGRRVPTLRRVAFALADAAAPPGPAAAFKPGPWVRELRLRPRSQMEEPDEVRGDICSPTSLAMAAEFLGAGRRTLAAARAVLDRATADSYGNWTLNTAAAGLWGLRAHVARLHDLEALQDEVAAGRPVVVSIAFPDGGLTGSPIPRSKGHLLAVAGFTAEGDVIAYDPAAPDRRSVRRVYSRTEFRRAWLEAKRGLAYALGRRHDEDFVARATAADVRRKPGEPRRPGPRDPGRATQVLFGERVRGLGAKGDWVKVEIPGQPYAGEPRRWALFRRGPKAWRGYPGWVRARDLAVPILAPEPDAVVAAGRSALRFPAAPPAPDRPEARVPPDMPLSMGTRLAVESWRAGEALARLPDGGLASVPAADIRRLDAADEPSAGRILEAAARLEGSAYVWGGRSSVHQDPSWGVDCSGLVHLAYLSEGVVLPRDARDQFLAAAPVRRAELQAADLVFLSEDRRGRDINHVMLYAGGDALLESRLAAGRTLATTFTERFGRPLSGIETGDEVPDLTTPGRERRRVFFGTFRKALGGFQRAP